MTTGRSAWTWAVLSDAATFSGRADWQHPHTQKPRALAPLARRSPPPQGHAFAASEPYAWGLACRAQADRSGVSGSACFRVGDHVHAVTLALRLRAAVTDTTVTTRGT